VIDLNFNLVASAGFFELTLHRGGVSFEELPMSNSAVKIASVFFVVLASSTASFARGGGSTAAVGGVRPNVGAAVSTAQSQMTDPSGRANAQKVAPLPPPRISAPQVPQFK
jgi:hypothetical protein